MPPLLARPAPCSPKEGQIAHESNVVTPADLDKIARREPLGLIFATIRLQLFKHEGKRTHMTARIRTVLITAGLVLAALLSAKSGLAQYPIQANQARGAHRAGWRARCHQPARWLRCSGRCSGRLSSSRIARGQTAISRWDSLRNRSPTATHCCPATTACLPSIRTCTRKCR